MTFHDVDPRALPDDLSFTPDGKAIVYMVRKMARIICACNRWMAGLTAS